MATNVLTDRTHAVSVNGLSWLQRSFLRRFHPRSIFMDVVGFIWFTYFFWIHDWKSAIAIVIVERIIAFFSVAHVDVEAFSDTSLGRIGLLHLHPANFAIQIFGSIILLYGIWQHATEVILGGVSLIFLGHIFGWAKVDVRYGDKIS